MLTWRTGHFQPTKYAFIQYFKDGATYGAALGFISATYYRRIMMVPKFGLAMGVTYGGVMAISQLYRHEI